MTNKTKPEDRDNLPSVLTDLNRGARPPSRRDLAGKLLLGVGVVGLASCIDANHSTASVEQALTGTNFLWADTLTDLRGLVGSDTTTLSKPVAVMGGYASVGDGGGGVFYWDKSSSSGDDGGTIIVPTGSTTGRWLRLYTGNISVRWFGAKGDGTSNDKPAIQAAIDSIAASGAQGGTVYFPPGDYKITTGLTAGSTGKLYTFAGAGPSGYSALLSHGVSRIIVPVGVTGLTYGPASSSHYVGAPVMHDLCFQGPGGTADASTIGVRLQNVSGFRLHDCTFADFGSASTGSGVGLRVIGIAPYESAYGHVDGCRFMNCYIGCDCTGAGYTQFRSCLFDGANNTLPSTLRAGTIAVKNPLAVLGCELQSFETLIDVDGLFNGCSFSDNRYENFVNAVYFHAPSTNNYTSMVRGGSCYSALTGALGVRLSSNSYGVTVDTRWWVPHQDDNQNNTILDPNYGYRFKVTGLDSGRTPLEIGFNNAMRTQFFVYPGGPQWDAPTSSVWFNTNGGVGTTFYVKRSAGMGGWFAVA
jgi:hypothetical protein